MSSVATTSSVCSMGSTISVFSDTISVTSKTEKRKFFFKFFSLKNFQCLSFLLKYKYISILIISLFTLALLFLGLWSLVKQCLLFLWGRCHGFPGLDLLGLLGHSFSRSFCVMLFHWCLLQNGEYCQVISTKPKMNSYTRIESHDT